MVFLKNCNVCHSIFLFKKRQTKVFYGVVDREIGFLDNKNID